MADQFPSTEVAKLLAQCHRRCCICHRFCGVKMELDHMKPKAEGGASDIDNAIPVCFECHAEIHGYNDQHPRGRKFKLPELKQHKQQWLDFCATNPGALAQLPLDAGAGPLQALLDELDFNISVANHAAPKELGCHLHDFQFRRAISTGALAVLDSEIKNAINDAYSLVGRANHFLNATISHAHGGNAYNTALNEVQKAVQAVAREMPVAKNKLLEFLTQK